MTPRSTLAHLALLGSLLCFTVALLISTAILHRANYHSWVLGGFVALVSALIINEHE